jgi:hypothetical protein
VSRGTSVSQILRDERGVTLFEALLTIVVGLGILGVTFLLMDVSFSQTAKISDRVEAVQRGRVTMENITRQLRSQVCPSSTGAAITDARDSSVTFYADLSGGAANPEQRTIAYDQTAKTLTEYRYVGSGTWPSVTYPASNAPTQTRELAKNIVPVSGTPVFRYYAFPTNGSQTHQLLTTPITTAPELSRVVRVEVSFVSQPSRTKQQARSTTFQSAVDTRTTNPNSPSETTRCL